MRTETGFWIIEEKERERERVSVCVFVCAREREEREREREREKKLCLLREKMPNQIWNVIVPLSLESQVGKKNPQISLFS